MSDKTATGRLAFKIAEAVSEHLALEHDCRIEPEDIHRIILVELPYSNSDAEEYERFLASITDDGENTPKQRNTSGSVINEIRELISADKGMPLFHVLKAVVEKLKQQRKPQSDIDVVYLLDGDRIVMSLNGQVHAPVSLDEVVRMLNKRE